MDDLILLEKLTKIRNPLSPERGRVIRGLQKIQRDLERSRPDKNLIEKIQRYWLPIADNFGMWKRRYAIEDLLFSHTDPAHFKLLASVIRKKHNAQQNIFKEIAALLKYYFKKQGITKHTVLFRRKNLYGLFQKMQMRNESVNHITDAFGVRVIVPKAEDCYRVVSTIHHMWPPYEERFKDYVRRPKQNGYQSIHTTVYCLDGTPVEFQIRTRSMDRVAKYGPANHADYKRKTRKTP